MKPMTLPYTTITDGTKVAIFDLSIKNLDERRERRLIAESKALAMRVLGLCSINRLETIIRNREHMTWQGKKITVRYEHPKYDEKICNDKPQPATSRSSAAS